MMRSEQNHIFDEYIIQGETSMLVAILLKQHRGYKLGAVNGAVSGAVNQVLQYITEMPDSRANAISETLNSIGIKNVNIRMS